MDPASAVVAFVGFTASLGALAEILVKGCKTLAGLKAIIEDAPDDIERLHRAMTLLQGVVVQIQKSTEDIEDLWGESHLSLLWAQHARRVENDIKLLRGCLEGIDRAFAATSRTSLHVRARIKKIFKEQDLVKYERILTEDRDIFQVFAHAMTEYDRISTPISREI